MTTPYLPTPEEIAAATALIRAEWSEMDRLMRERDWGREDRIYYTVITKLKKAPQTERAPRIHKLHIRRKGRDA